MDIGIIMCITMILTVLLGIANLMFIGSNTITWICLAIFLILAMLSHYEDNKKE